MTSKTIQYLLVAGIVLLATFTITMVAMAIGPGNSFSFLLPPTPTPGPPPPPAPDVPRGGMPVTSRDEAIQRALFLDSMVVIREQPLTMEGIAASSDLIVAESYKTRQEAANTYWGDGFADSKIASEPVWVVIIKGEVSVKLIGGLGANAELIKSDGVTYEISQVDGALLRVVAGISQKRNQKSL